MRKSSLIFALIYLLLMLSPISNAEWTKLKGTTNIINGNSYYVNFDDIKNVDDYVYWWELEDYQKKDKFGDLSAKAYLQGDCKLFRYKTLKVYFYQKQMGVGKSIEFTPPEEWKYPKPENGSGLILVSICSSSLSEKSEWIEFDKNSLGDVYYHTSNPNKIKINEDNGKYSVVLELLVNYEQPIQNGKSAIVKYEFSCSKMEMRNLEDRFYTKKFGKGELIEISSNPTKWFSMESVSVYGNVRNTLCKRLK